MHKFIIFLFAALLLSPHGITWAREAGWVPIPTEPWQPPLTSGAKSLKKTGKETPQIKISQPGATVYDRQPIITETELNNFLPLLPQFRAWAKQNQEDAHPILNANGKPDFQYSQKAAQWVASHGFQPARFFCIMGRMAAGLAIIEEGNDLAASRPRDMPPVDQKEISLARRHLGELLTAATQPAN